MRLLWEISNFARSMHREMRFGKLSRAPLHLLRVEWHGNAAECDWLARPADEWDQGLPRHASEGHFSEQALRDAIDVREFLFDSLLEVETASLRVFRQSPDGTRELIITGAVTRREELPRKVPSTAMRAKLLGFQFCLQDGTLEAIQSEECAMSF